MRSLQAGTTVPLTSEQRAWLWTNSVLPVATVAGLVGGGLLCNVLVGRFLTAPFVPLLLGGIALLIAVAVIVAGRFAYHHAADLRLGVAYQRDAELLAKRETTQSPRTFSGDFRDVGALAVPYEVYTSLAVGQRYRVTYSPHTRRGWAIAPLAEG